MYGVLLFPRTQPPKLQHDPTRMVEDLLVWVLDETEKIVKRTIPDFAAFSEESRIDLIHSVSAFSARRSR